MGYTGAVIELRPEHRELLRHAAVEVGVLTTSAYDEWRFRQDPMPVAPGSLVQRYRCGWAELLEAAELEPTGFRHWSDEELRAVVAEFLAARPDHPTIEKYAEWRGDRELPASITIAARLGVGSWRRALGRS